MSKIKFAEIVKSIKLATLKHSPAILTGIGIAGMISATAMAVKATPKALMLIEAQKKAEKTEKLTIVDSAKVAWVCYIPAAITIILSSACLIGANSVNTRRNAALAAAYTLSESALKEYQGKVVETIGEKKEQIVREAVAKDKLNSNPVSNNEVIVTERGNALCYDPISGRYFRSDADSLKRAASYLSRQLLDEMYVSLNDFYSEIGLAHTEMGDDLGWYVNDGWIDMRFDTQLAEDGTPCLVLGYTIAPRYDYRR